eukprot:CCRYP_004151-RA/>CCRYP_004151-RA protein AED:0.00 eAED:0.00 QI:151/-1/1/1/-1/1/1/928/600
MHEMKARYFLLSAPLLITRPSSLTAAAFGSSLKGQQIGNPSTFHRLLKKEDDIPPLPLPPSCAPSLLPTLQPSNGPSNGPSISPSWPPTTLAPTSESVDIVDATQPPSTSSPTAITEEPTTAIPSLSPSQPPTHDPSASPVTVRPNVFPVATARNSHTHKIALSPFRIDIVATASQQGSNGTVVTRRNLQQQPHQRRLRHLASRPQDHAHSNDARHLQTFFQSSQDIQLSSVISYHLLMQYQRYADELSIPSTQIVGVDFDVTDKTESVFGQLGDVHNVDGTDRALRPEVTLVLVSYIFDGDVVVASPYALDGLDAVTLQSFTDTDKKKAFLAILASSDDEMLRSITDVDATPVLPLDTFHDVSSNEMNGSGTMNTATTSNNNDNKILIPTLISLAFLSTLSFLGYLTHKKYSEYQRNNANNTYLSYQQRKSRLAVDTRYNPFESPPSSVTENETPTSQDTAGPSVPLHEYDGMHRMMNMRMAMEDSSSEDEQGWSSASTSTDVLDWNVPYDEVSIKQQQQQQQQPYDEQTTMQLRMIQTGTTELKMENGSTKHHLGIVRPKTFLNESPTDDDATLDGLYSTNDSYFDAHTARSERNHGK